MINEIELVKKKKDKYKAIKNVNIKDIKNNKEILLHINFDQVPEDSYEVNLYQISTNSKKLIKVIPSNNNQDTNIYYKVPLNNLAIGEYEFEIIINNEETILFRFKVYKKNKLIIPIIILSAALLVGIGGYIIYQNTPNKIELKEQDNKEIIDKDGDIKDGEYIQDESDLNKNDYEVRFKVPSSVAVNMKTGKCKLVLENPKYRIVETIEVEDEITGEKKTEETGVENIFKIQYQIMYEGVCYYTSPLLEPDSYIDNIRLDTLIDEAGIYEAEILCNYYDNNNTYISSILNSDFKIEVIDPYSQVITK